MGALPKPMEEKILEGMPANSSADPGIRKNEPIGACPRGEPLEVREIWNTLSKDWELVLTVMDRPVFLIYCRTQHLYNEAWKEVQAGGEYDYNSHDRAVIAASAQRLSSLADQLLKMLPQFGATPVTRQRVPSGEKVKPSEARRGGLELLTGGRGA